MQDKKRVLIIIPTYNEKENIPTLLDKIFVIDKSESLADFTINVLVVDDNSPDNTANIVKELAISKYQNRLYILERAGKMGLGTAYIAGFKWAIDKAYDFVFEMDADFSHNPEYIPDFLRHSENYDLILGTRYIKGGGVVNWGKHRIFISKGGNFYSRLLLWLPYHDLTGGYKCFNIKVLKSLDLDNILSNGYSFQIELTYRAHLKGFKIKEVPIIFHDRIAGKSKLSGNVFREAVWKVILLRLKKKDFKNSDNYQEKIEKKELTA